MASRKGEHMKTLGYRFVAIAVLTTLSFVSSVWAQAGNAIEFKVTSSFVAGDAKFPAGTYTIRQDPDNQQEWEISNDSKGYSAFLPTEPSPVSSVIFFIVRVSTRAPSLSKLLSVG
jgi:hypothetical protein